MEQRLHDAREAIERETGLRVSVSEVARKLLAEALDATERKAGQAPTVVSTRETPENDH